MLGQRHRSALLAEICAKLMTKQVNCADYSDSDSRFLKFTFGASHVERRSKIVTRCGPSSSELHRIPRPKILDQPQQNARAGLDIGRLDVFVRMMADAAAAAHEQHGDVGNIDHGHAVMPGPARQFEHAMTFRRDGRRQLAPEPRRAGYGAVLVGDIDLQRQLSAPGDVFDSAHDIGNSKFAVRIGGARISMVKDT
jgi:hypothetical protein